ncbi:MAG: hypothetical protein GTN82_12800 [Candidatus Aminicenantes bacterium]|nr:hypothetical protein [Candidatus Aminicenantes bacterium]
MSECIKYGHRTDPGKYKNIGKENMYQKVRYLIDENDEARETIYFIVTYLFLWLIFFKIPLKLS